MWLAARGWSGGAGLNLSMPPVIWRGRIRCTACQFVSLAEMGFAGTLRIVAIALKIAAKRQCGNKRNPFFEGAFELFI